MHAVTLPDAARERGKAMGLDKPIDPKTTAVISVDFQRFFVEDGQPMGTVHAQDALKRANELNAAVRAAGGTVVITQHSFGPSDEDPAPSERSDEPGLVPASTSYDLHPDLVVDEKDLRIVKRKSSPLHPEADTDLLDELKKRGVETVIVSGLASNGCCDCLARDAFQHGFNVVFASDASAAMTDEEHNATLLNLAIYYAQVLDTASIVKTLSGQPAA